MDSPTVSATLVKDSAVGHGRYRLERELGRGGMGVVWLAQDSVLNEWVALKFIPPEVSRDVSMVDDLKRETQKSRKLTHPSIIRIHDLCLLEGESAFISMEYVEGMHLGAFKTLQEFRCFSWEMIEPWAEQLCAALAYAHEEGVIHRDIKPSNVML